MITNFLRQQATLVIGNQIQYLSVGTGSQTLDPGMTTLTGSEYMRVLITGSPNFTTAQSVTFSADINSTQASGLVLTQFGVFSGATINVGSAYTINQLNGSLVCDGTIELSFESSVRVI